jgi:hypothetical protein
MQKILLIFLILTTFTSCGNKKNTDEVFLEQVRDEETERYEPVRPNLEELSFRLKKVTANNIVFDVLIYQGSSSQYYFLNADRSTRIVSSVEREVGNINCLNLACSEFVINILNKYSINFALRDVSISGKFFEEDFQLLNKGISAEYVLKHNDKVISGTEIFSKPQANDSSFIFKDFYYRDIIINGPSVQERNHRFQVWLSAKLQSKNIYYLPKIELDETSNTYEGFYLDLSTNSIHSYFLKAYDEN